MSHVTMALSTQLMAQRLSKGVPAPQVFERWAQAHERAFLTAFITLCLLALGAAAVEAALAGHAVEVIIAWAGTFAVTATAMLITHRSGRLILRRADDRRRQAAINQASRRATPLILGMTVLLVALVGLDRHVVFAALGGALTAFGPVLLWIAFVLRPDQHLNEDL
jgi:hypothetical protein